MNITQDIPKYQLILHLFKLLMFLKKNPSLYRNLTFKKEVYI